MGESGEWRRFPDDAVEMRPDHESAHADLRVHLHESIIFIKFYSRTAYSERLIKQDTVLYICMDLKNTPAANRVY